MDAVEVAYSIPITVEKGDGVDLVDDSVLPPSAVGGRVRHEKWEIEKARGGKGKV